MKNQIISSLVLAVLLQSCSSGSSSGSAAGGTTLPANSEWSKVETNLLFKMDRCVNINAVSARFYITKISSTQYLEEVDTFEAPNCESAPNASISDSARTIRTITGETTNVSDANFKDLALVHTNSEQAVWTVAMETTFNNINWCGYNDWSATGGVNFRNINSCYASVTPGYTSVFTFKYDPVLKRITLPNGDFFE